MLTISALMVAIAAPAPVQAVEQVDVAFEEIVSGENQAAIAQLESNVELESDDPSRLINLGVAYAREGEISKARDLFQSALYARHQQLVETADGKWVNSRVLARRALRSLDRAETENFAQVAFAHTE